MIREEEREKEKRGKWERKEERTEKGVNAIGRKEEEWREELGRNEV